MFFYSDTGPALFFNTMKRPIETVHTNITDSFNNVTERLCVSRPVRSAGLPQNSQ